MSWLASSTPYRSVRTKARSSRECIAVNLVDMIRADGGELPRVASTRGGEYAGIGPGAHGRLAIDGRRQATRQIRAPEAWLAAVEERGHGTRSQTPLEPKERAIEVLMMGLRLGEGVSRERFRRLSGRDLEDFVPAAALQRLVAGGFLELDRGALRATAAGRRVLNAVLGELLP